MKNTFLESFQRTIVRFDSLSEGKKADYERTKRWEQRRILCSGSFKTGEMDSIREKLLTQLKEIGM